MEKSKSAKRYSAEVRSRAVRMVLEHGADHALEWAATGSQYSGLLARSPGDSASAWTSATIRRQGLRSCLGLKQPRRTSLAGPGPPQQNPASRARGEMSDK